MNKTQVRSVLILIQFDLYFHALKNFPGLLLYRTYADVSHDS